MIVDLEALPVQAKFLALSSLSRITDGDVQGGCRLHDGSDDGIKDIRGTGSGVLHTHEGDRDHPDHGNLGNRR